MKFTTALTSSVVLASVAPTIAGEIIEINHKGHEIDINLSDAHVPTPRVQNIPKDILEVERAQHKKGRHKNFLLKDSQKVEIEEEEHHSLVRRQHKHHIHKDVKKRDNFNNSGPGITTSKALSSSTKGDGSSTTSLAVSNQCVFPTNAGLVAITPDKPNAGWAMSPDQQCLPGKYCPYACPPGQVMAQWDPAATSYTYPVSMNGGLFCNADGVMEKPFPDKPYCVPGTGSAMVRNVAGGVVSFCQTVLPGNEAMLIPTEVSPGAFTAIAVPDTSYWLGTAAHYYVNAPGVPATQGCVWGSKESPAGNWSPYVAGANTDADGRTYVKLGWNPIYLQPDSPHRNELPTFGLRLVCEGSCAGIPCAINPVQNGINQVTSLLAASGAGGGDFCVGTAEPGSKIHIEIFDVNNPNPGSTSSQSSSSSSSVLLTSSAIPTTSTSSQKSQSSSVFSIPNKSLSSSSSSSPSPSSSSKATSTSRFASISLKPAFPSSYTQTSTKQTSSNTPTAKPSSTSYKAITPVISSTTSVTSGPVPPITSSSSDNGNDSSTDDGDDDSGEYQAKTDDAGDNNIPSPSTSTVVVLTTSYEDTSPTGTGTATDDGDDGDDDNGDDDDDRDSSQSDDGVTTTIQLTSVHAITKVIGTMTVTADPSDFHQHLAQVGHLSFTEDSENAVVTIVKTVESTSTSTTIATIETYEVDLAARAVRESEKTTSDDGLITLKPTMNLASHSTSTKRSGAISIKPSVVKIVGVSFVAALLI